jgi:hypothetical protein
MTTVRIPADVDREDTLLAGLTARQLAWLSIGGLVLLGAWSASRRLVPLPVFAAVAVPFASLLLALALGRRDGMAADRFALVALRHLRAPRRLVPVPEGVDAPAWPEGGDEPTAPLPFPVAGVADDGILDLAAQGLVQVCRASSLNFGLRSPEEQEALVAALGRWLNSLDAPVQIVVRAERVDVARSVAALRERAESLTHPALASAARGHADFVHDLAGRRDVLRRAVLVVFRQPSGPGGDELLRRRVEEAGRALGGAGVSLSPLSAQDVVAVVGRAVDPDAVPRPDGLALPGETIRRSL